MERNTSSFNGSVIQGHWIKGAELVIGAVMVAMAMVWGREARWASCLGDPVDISTVAGGVALVVVACLGLVGAILRIDALLWLHLGSLLVVLLFLLSITLFTLEVTRGRPSSDASQHLSDFPAWFQHRVEHWDRIVASCLLPPPSLCYASPVPGPTLKLGCCEPPSSCNFTYDADANSWSPSNQTSSTAAAGPDCAIWSNAPSQLCYYCDSCKVVIVRTTWKHWKKFRTLLLLAISIILSLYAFCGCALFKHDDGGYVHHV